MSLNDLDRLIPQYAANKSELDGYKKICDRENAEIKAIMKDFALQNYVVGGYKASYSRTKKDTPNEAKLIEIAKRHGIAGVVKTKEYFDFDALEKAIYDGEISDHILLEIDGAIETKEVETLRISKAKKKEN